MKFIVLIHNQYSEERNNWQQKDKSLSRLNIFCTEAPLLLTIIIYDKAFLTSSMTELYLNLLQL